MPTIRWIHGGCLAFLLTSCAPPPDSSVNDYLGRVGFVGSALVVKDGVPILREGFGLANAELSVPNTPDLVYRIGSLTKPVTASGVLKASEQGHFDLSDEICDFLSPCPASWSDVQVAHLLNHTSGIPDYFGNLPSAPLLETTNEVDRLLSELGTAELRSAPGSAYAYSNFNYVLLGALLRRTTGTDWETYLIEEVLAPVGARSTAYDDVFEVVKGQARGYGRGEGVLRHVEYDDHSAYAAGGLRSTVDDLRAWHDALQAGAIVDAALVSRGMQAGEGDYGYGWQIIEALGRELQNHTGGIDGFTSHLAWYPSDELLIILLSNVEGTPVKALACDVARLVLGTPTQPSGDPGWQAQDVQERCGTP